MTKASEAIKAVFQFIPEVMQYQGILEQLLIKYATEACEEQKEICAEKALYLYYTSDVVDSIDKEVINSRLPVFQ